MSNQTNKKSPQDRGDNEEKDINMSLRSIWLGRQDSNLRMSAPKTDALPLGHAPASITTS